MPSLTFFSRCFLIMITATAVAADIVRYSVSGIGSFEETGSCMLTGYMDINDEYTVIPPLNFRDVIIQYDITEFNFMLGDQEIEGMGSLNYHYYDYESSPVNCEFDPFVLVASNVDVMFESVTTNPVFYHADGTPYSETDPFEYFTLPERVVASLTEAIGSDYNGAIISWEWNKVKNVPEPAVFFMIGVGLLCLLLAGYIRKQFGNSDVSGIYSRNIDQKKGIE